MKTRNGLRIACVAMLVYTAVSSMAGNVYWDGGSVNIGGDGNSASAGGNGTWDITTLNWDAGAVPHVSWNNANNDIAVFGGTAGTVTNQGVTVGGLTFTTANYVITSNTVTFGSEGTISNSAAATIYSALAGAGPVTKTGAGTLTLSGANSYTGGTVILGGIIQVGSSDGMLGASGGSITLDGGTLRVVSANLSSTRDVVVGAAGGGIGVNGNNNFTTTGKLTGTGTFTMASVSGAGGQTLNFNSTANDFTGGIRVPSNTPTVSFNSLADSTNNIVFNGAQGGTFTWGSGAIVPLVLNSRAFALAGTAAGQTYTINNANTTAANSITINTDLSNTTAYTKTLVLQGANTGNNIFAGKIGDGPSAAALGVRVGSSYWTLSGTNTYSGITVPDNVTLTIRGKPALSPNSLISFDSNNGSAGAGGGRLNLYMDDSGIVSLGNQVNVRTAQTSGGITAQWTIFAGNNGGGTTGSTLVLGKMNFASISDPRAGGYILNVTGANGYRLQLGNVDLATNVGSGGNSAPTKGQGFNPTTAPLTISGTVQHVAGQALGVKPETAILMLSGTASGNLVSGNILNPADYGSNTNALPLTISKLGTGDWTLSGTNTYSGVTTVTAGKLLFSGASALPTGPVTVAAAAHLSFADNTAQNFTNAALTLASGAMLSFDWTGDSTGDQLTSIAAITNAANSLFPVIINRSGTPAGSVTLLTGGAGSTLSNSKFFLVNTTNFTAELTVTPTTVSVGNYADVTPLTTFYWQGNKVLGAGAANNYDNAWALSAGLTNNWSASTPLYTATGLTPGPASDVIFANGQTGKTLQNTVLGAAMTVNSVTIDDSTTVTIAGGTPNYLLTLLGTNATAGTVAAPGSAISVTANANTTNTITARVLLGANQTWNVATNKTLTVSGVVDGNCSLTKAGPGTLSLNGVNTYIGETVINGGTFRVGNATAASLGGGIYTNAITLNNNSVLLVMSTASQTLSGPISGSGSLTKNLGGTTGTLTLSGPNTYTGPTTITAGGGSDGGTLIVSSFNSVNGGVPLLASSSMGCPTNVADGTISIGNLTAANPCYLIYTGPGETTDRNLYFNTRGSSAHTVTASGTGLLKFTGTISGVGGSGPTAPIILSGTGAGEIANTVSNLYAGNMGITKSGTGTWTLSGTNTYSGVTTVSGGTLVIGASGVLGGGLYSNNIPISAGATFAYSSSAVQQFYGIISGAGAIVMNGTGTLTLFGTNTYSGATSISNGLLTVVTGGYCTNSAVTVASAAALGVSVTNNTRTWSCASLALNNGSQVRYSFAVAPGDSVAPLSITGNLTFSGTPEIVVSPGKLTPGIYPLLKQGGTALTDLPTLSGVTGTLSWSGSGNKTLLLTVQAPGTLIRIY